MNIAERKPNHVPPHVAAYIDELEADRDKLVGVIRDLIKADRSMFLMRKESARSVTKPLLIFAAGCIVGLVVGIASDDFRARAVTDEVLACPDKPDRKAYMARLPGETHTTEFCLHAFRFGSPNWIPEFQHPLQRRPDGHATR